MIVEEYDDDGKSRTMDMIWDGERSEEGGGGGDTGYVVTSVE